MKIAHLDLPQDGRLFAISELYGHFPALNAWLSNVQFRPAVDRIVLLGNFLGFAPSSRQAAAYLAKPWIKAVLGPNEADVLMRLQGRCEGLQTLVGQWLPMLTDTDRSQISEALSGLPVALEWESRQGMAVLSQAPIPVGIEWSAHKQQLQMIECPKAGLDSFMGRIDLLGCIGRLGTSPKTPAAGVAWSISGYSVEKVEKAVLIHKNRVIIPSSARMAQDSCYDTRCTLGSMELTAFIHQSETNSCHIDILPELFPKKTSSTSLR